MTTFRTKIKAFLAGDSPTLFLSRREVEELNLQMKTDAIAVKRTRGVLKRLADSVDKRIKELGNA